ncbi:MAG: phytanoyl-CoA dioxygenase family protein [Ilumatobacter sp.]
MAWLSADDSSFDEFVAVVEQTVDPADYAFAARVDHGAVVYDAHALRSGDRFHHELAAELAHAFSDGPGIVVFEGAVAPAIVDAATIEFRAIIEHERSSGIASGDHFAANGVNDRVWNALQKLARRSPEVFADYYANDVIAAASAAWLGPGYQVTSQVNVVNPGGQAQVPHRDYHLGFMNDDQAERFPAHVHRLSPALTLQGAIAHCDMPVESGPTMYLPHSHKFEAGYVAARRDDIKAYFAEHHVQLALTKGDAVFFNPAMFHGAGTNRTTDISRVANLLQVGSAMGRTLEAVDRREMVELLYPTLLARAEAGGDRAALDRVVAASAEGYPFPCDLDVDQPVDALVPPSDADIVRLALTERWPPSRLAVELTA